MIISILNQIKNNLYFKNEKINSISNNLDYFFLFLSIFIEKAPFMKIVDFYPFVN